MPSSYQIVRYFRDGREPKIIARKQTLEAARLHCRLAWTAGANWFDGFREVKSRRK